MPDPQRIALVRLSHLGDVVLALPLFHALRARFPQAKLAWVIQPEFAGLLEGLAGLERVVLFQRRGGAGAWLELQRELARFAPDLAVDAQGNWKSAMVCLASGAPRRVGPAAGDARERGAWFAWNERCAPLASGEQHAFDLTRALVHEVCGVVELRRDPALNERELRAGRAELDARLGPAQAPLVLQLSQPGDVRAWPHERSVEFARLAARAGRHVLVLSGPSEASAGELAAHELAGEARVAHWIGQRGLRLAAAVLHAAAERGGDYVGPDTGPTHLAAACGLRVTLVAGPQSHERTGPWPVAEPSRRGASSHRVVRSARELDCAPCFARRCSRSEGPVCMASIEAARVLEALART